MSALTIRLQQYPNEFFDFVKEEMDLKNDAALARLMNVNQATMSRLRHHVAHNQTSTPPRITDTHILSLYDATGMSIELLRSKLYNQEFVKPLLSPHEIVRRRRKAEKEDTAEKQRLFRESIVCRQSLKEG